jgi:hypothetical protein
MWCTKVLRPVNEYEVPSTMPEQRAHLVDRY